MIHPRSMLPARPPCWLVNPSGPCELVVGRSVLYQWKAGKVGPLDRHVLERLSYLFGFPLNRCGPQNLVWYNVLALAYLFDGKPGDALGRAAAALAVRPTWRAAMRTAAAASAAAGQWPQAAEWSRRAAAAPAASARAATAVAMQPALGRRHAPAGTCGAVRRCRPSSLRASSTPHQRRRFGPARAAPIDYCARIGSPPTIRVGRPLTCCGRCVGRADGV